MRAPWLAAPGLRSEVDAALRAAAKQILGAWNGLGSRGVLDRCGRFAAANLFARRAFFAGAELAARAATASAWPAGAFFALGFAAAGLAVDRGVGELFHDELDRAHRVVVARNRKVDQVRIAVGIDQRDRLHAELLRFLNRDVLAARVDDEHQAGHALHAADAFEVRLDLRALAIERRLHLLRVSFDLAGFPK